MARATETAGASSSLIRTRAFGRSEESVTELGLGGEGVLRSVGRGAEAIEVITQALERGVRYFDSAPAYGESLDYYGAALDGWRHEAFLSSKTASRSREGSLRILDQTLNRLRTDYLDLLQLHDVRTPTDLKRIFGRGGAIEALDEARSAGAIRFTGITGDHRPDVLLHAIREYPFDALLIPLNPADHVRLPFKPLLLEAHQRGIAVIAMRVFCSGLLLEYQRCTARDALRYVWSLKGVTTAIVGCGSPAEIDDNASTARDYRQMTADQRRQLESRCAFAALTPYKAARLPRALSGPLTL